MTTIIYDHDRLRRALELLLDGRFGAERAKLLREKIAIVPGRTVKYYRAVEPLNEIVSIARQNKLKAIDLVDRADALRATAARRLQREAPQVLAKRKNWAEQARANRARLNLAADIREMELGHQMTDGERTAYKKAVQQTWSQRRRDAIASKPGLLTWQIHEQVTAQIDAELEEAQKKAEAMKQEREAKAKRDAEVRQMSDPAKRRLDAQAKALQDRWSGGGFNKHRRR